MGALSYLEGSFCYAVQLVVGQDQVSQVDQALEVGVVQGGEAVGVQVEGVEVLQVGEGVRQDLTDGVPAQSQVDLRESSRWRQYALKAGKTVSDRSSRAARLDQEEQLWPCVAQRQEVSPC